MYVSILNLLYVKLAKNPECGGCGIDIVKHHNLHILILVAQQLCLLLFV